MQAYDDFGFDLDALDALSLRQMQVRPGGRAATHARQTGWAPPVLRRAHARLLAAAAALRPLPVARTPGASLTRRSPALGPLQSFVRACEAAAAEARERGAPPPSGAASWPQLLLGAGLRPYRPPKGSRRLRRPQQGQAGVKREEQQGDMPPPAAVQPGQKQPLAGGVAHAAPPHSTLTPEEVAAAAAAAGMISPLLPPTVLPPAGSAVAPNGLSAAAGTLPPPAAPAQQQQQAPKQQQQQPAAAPRVAAPVVGSNTPVAPLGPAGAAQPAAPAPALPAPTAAQMAAVAASTPQQQQLLSQMHSMLTAAAQAQAAPGQKQGQEPS